MIDGTDSIHATAIVLDGYGILIRGRSGSGKSLLALDLLDRAAVLGGAGYLISDDRVMLSNKKGELIGAAPKQITGQIELRGFGIIERPTVERAPIHLVVDLVDELNRMPENQAFETEIEGVKLVRCPVPACSLTDCAHQRLLVLEALKLIGKKF